MRREMHVREDERPKCARCGKAMFASWDDAAANAHGLNRQRKSANAVVYWDRRCREIHVGTPSDHKHRVAMRGDEKMAINEITREQMAEAQALMRSPGGPDTLADALEAVLNGGDRKVKVHKYGAVPTRVDGIRFASKAEARRYEALKEKEALGLIVNLELQPVFQLTVQGTVIGKYVGDFRYLDVEKDEVIVEDVKGVKTPMYRWKRSHVKAQYGIDIVEVA